MKKFCWVGLFVFSCHVCFSQDFQKRPSTITIPIDFSIDDIQVSINKNMPQLMVEDNSFDDNNKDELKLKVFRKGNLVFQNVNNDVLSYEIPLKIWVQKRISALGISQYPSTEFEVLFKFQTKFSIKPDYNILTVSSSLGFDWISKPVLKTSIIDIPIASVVGKVLENKMGEYAAEIDKTIMQSFQMRPFVIDAWNKALEPLKVSEDYNTWVKIEPIEIIATPFRSEKRNIKASLGMKVLMETFVGNPKYEVKKVKTIPAIRYVQSVPNDFEVQLFTIVSYEAATAISQKIFVGQKYDFKNGKYNIEILDISVERENEYLLLKTKTKGSFKGDIFIKGIPYYDPSKNLVLLKNTELSVKTKNFLHKSAAWLLEGYMEKKIESDFGMPVQEIIDFGKSSVNESLNKEITPNIIMTGNVISVLPEGVSVNNEGIVANIVSKVKVELKVKGF